MSSAADGLSREVNLGISSTLIVLCTGFVGIRCAIQMRDRGRLFSDDYLSILGLVLTITFFAFNDFIIRRFTSPEGNLQWLIETGIAITVLINAALWVTKAPILLVYIRVFGVKKWLALTCWLTLLITALAYIGVMVPTFIRCDTTADPVTFDTLGVCVTGTTLTGVITGFIALATDVLIFFLPMSPIYALHLPTAKKLALGAVFFSGVLGIVASIVSLYYKWRAYNGQTSDTQATMLCAVVECTIALIIGSAPAFKNFWSNFIVRARPAVPTSMYPNVPSTKPSELSSRDYYQLSEISRISRPRGHPQDWEGGEMDSETPAVKPAQQGGWA